jgi:hypothetical protein
MPCFRLAEIAAAARSRFPKARIGINVPDEHPLTAIPQLPRIDGFWAGDPCFIEGPPTQDLAGRTAKSLKSHHPAAVYFGSAALKYQPQPRNLKAVTQLACKHIDVITAAAKLPEASRRRSPAELRWKTAVGCPILHGVL